MSGTPSITIDSAVRACFPPEHQVISAQPYGSSSWSHTARVVVRLRDGSIKAYFLRCVTASSDVKIQGEFISMKKLHETNPDVVPRPHTWDPASLCTHLARIHGTTQTTMEFGFDAPRLLDGVVLEPAWDSSWAACFRRLVTAFFDHEIAVNGRWPVYEAAFRDLVCHAVPRLLEPLQSKGRQISPSLVHGNLSFDNVAVRQVDGMPVLFSACAMYAHREYELGAVRNAGNGFDSAFVDQYLRIALPSEPIDEVYDRIILYGIRFNLGFSISHNAVVRKSIYEDMRYLNGIYADK